ncbi:putative phage holin [Mycolicibacterium austroafricanum]|uniref:putative phage holin n=1 Tax=Mycolicibacterium austroafricanum TaxID=39687 RepID=UPI001ABF7D51|nr:hypothetical protein [Mycolicibacterium austroafricanum]QRZ05871.1 hypothetical protein JN090_23570 [Mycolicibacterium austroafricanum]
MMWLYIGGAAAIAATFLADLWLNIDYRFAADVSLIHMAVLVTVFTGMYGWRASWRVNRIGKVFLAKGIAFSLVLWQIVVAVWVDVDYPGRQHIRFAIYSLGAVAYAAMLITLWVEQRADRRRDTAK